MEPRGGRTRQMLVTVHSPDGLISGQLKGGRNARISFRDGAYAQYAVPALAHQLQALMRLGLAGYHRGREMIFANAGFETYGYDKPHWNKVVRDIRDEAAQSEVFGVSARRFVGIRSEGLRTFDVQLDDDCLQELSEEDFGSEFGSAVASMIADWRDLIRELKERRYG